MTSSERDFETRLARQLSEDDREFLRNLQDGRGLFRQLGDTLQGPMRFWVRLTFVMSFVTTGIGFWAVYELFQADTTRGQILWLFGAWAGWTAQTMIKQWLFERMNTLSILREIKKIEIRLASLENS